VLRSGSVRWLDRSIAAEDFNLTFDFDRDIEGQLRKTHRTTAVGADLRSKQLEYEIGESVYHARLLVEPRSGVDHAENPRPGGNALEAAERAPKAS